MQNIIISAQQLTKNYGTPKAPILAVNSINFEIEQGSFTMILGKSGSGKSTLLNLLTGLDKATSGVLEVNGENLSNMSSRKLADYRSNIGIIFQFYHLLSNLNAVENILMGSWAGHRAGDRQRAEELMTSFGLGHRIEANVKTLSGGEKQRVAICRSLINNPSILFCDEPTGALDSANEREVMEILQKLNREGMTIVMVTHAPEFARLADTVISMQDGHIDTIEKKEKVEVASSQQASAPSKLAW